MRLRPLRRADLRRRLEFTNDEEIQRCAAGEYIGPGDLHTIHTWFESVAADPHSQQLAIETVAEGHYLGDFDLHSIDRERGEAWLIPLFGDRANGSPAEWAEALDLVLRHAFDGLGLQRVSVELVDVDRLGMDVLEGRGFQVADRIENTNGTCSLIYELSAERFRATAGGPGEPELP